MLVTKKSNETRRTVNLTRKVTVPLPFGGEDFQDFVYRVYEAIESQLSVETTQAIVLDIAGDVWGEEKGEPGT
jgi:hypothetical protein